MKNTTDFSNYSYKEDFEKIIYDIISNKTVRQMKNYKQHYDTDCYEHCRNVAYCSYIICRKLHLNYVSAARAGMLHDLFLYDWRKRENGRKGLHAFTHPKTALTNANKLFDLSNLEQDIILKHMWPVTIKFPKYKESYVITVADKYCAIMESFKAYMSMRKIQLIYRYAYVFLSMFILFR